MLSLFRLDVLLGQECTSVGDGQWIARR